jgi:hypothetical protein
MSVSSLIDALAGLVIDEPTQSHRNGRPIKLESVKVNAFVHDFAAEVSIVQTYVSEETANVPVKYVFPLDANAAVCSFTAQISGRTVTGVVHDKPTAQRLFDDAVKSKRAAVRLIAVCFPDFSVVLTLLRVLSGVALV